MSVIGRLDGEILNWANWKGSETRMSAIPLAIQYIIYRWNSERYNEKTTDGVNVCGTL